MLILSLKFFLPLNLSELTDDILQLGWAFGAIVYCIATFRLKKMKKSSALLVILAWPFMAVQAQDQGADYSTQVEAFRQSFAEKSIGPVQAYISPKLQFGPLPVQNTKAILTNIFAQFPKLNSMDIKEQESGKALIAFDFEQLGTGESYIHFDDQAKIAKIDFLDRIIEQQIEAQKASQKGAKAPTPGQLAEQFMPKAVSFKSKDGLKISGQLYEVGKDKPVILLCHQAGYNKYEYADIAPKLNQLGYNCLAIDQRSGGEFADHQNATFNEAAEQGIQNIDFVDAQQDMEAAVDFLYKKYKKPVTVWGSSYSSSLALFIAAEHEKVKAALAFSPGNYFGKARPPLAEVLPKLDKPFFITSSKAEAGEIKKHLKGVALSGSSVHFVPESDGFHGSKALWTGQEGAEEYWEAVKEFLEKIYK